jgi:hypothetical protein
MTHGNYKPLPCVFQGTHGNTSALTFDRPDRADHLTELTGVNLCHAFLNGARQSYTIAVRFCKAHGNEFLKNEFSHLLSIFPPQVHYFALYISIMQSYLSFC